MGHVGNKECLWWIRGSPDRGFPPARRVGTVDGRGFPRFRPGDARFLLPNDVEHDAEVHPVYLHERSPRTVPPAALPVLIAVAVGLIPLPAAWPYWVSHPIPAVLAVVLSGLLAGAGLLLAQRGGSPRTGLLLLAAAVLFAVGWVLARNTGAYPLIGEYTQSFFFLALGTGILLHGRPRFDRWYERAWVIEAFVILLFSQTAICLTVPPERLGYAPDVLWFNLDVPEPVGSAVTEAGAILYVVLALTFVLVLVLQQRKPGPRNSTAMIVVSGVFAVTAAVVQYPIMGTDSSVDAIMSARGAQGTTAIILPLTLFAGALRAAWQENRVAARLVTLIGHATSDSVQSALRVVLRDPALEVQYWIPGAAAYVDTAGRLRRSASGVKILTPAGDPLAVCVLNAAEAEHDPAVRTALQASSSALQAVQMQLVHAEEMRDIQDRLMAAEDDGRKELARDLHDGVQQELAALRLQLIGLLGLGAAGCRP